MGRNYDGRSFRKCHVFMTVVSVIIHRAKWDIKIGLGKLIYFYESK